MLRQWDDVAKVYEYYHRSIIYLFDGAEDVLVVKRLQTNGTLSNGMIYIRKRVFEDIREKNAAYSRGRST